MKFLVKKWYKAIINILSMLISAAGLAITVITLFVADPGNNAVIIYILIIILSLLMIGATVYNVFSVLKEQGKKQEFDDVRDELNTGKKANRVIYENYKTSLTTFKDCADHLRDRITEYKKAYTAVDVIEEKLSATPGSVDLDSYIKTQREDENSELCKALIIEYNRFIGAITNTLRRSIEEYLTTKGCYESVSITLKQLEYPVKYKDIDEKNANVYTAFRDFRTYSSKKRGETWGKAFKISKNSDFINSIEKDYFIFNFMTKKSLEDGLYQNENSTFYEHYNSGVTCTVYSCVGGERKLFGYLACDSLFNNKVKKRIGNDIYDWNVANILMHSAQIIAMYLELLLDYWDTYYIKFDKTKTFADNYDTAEASVSNTDEILIGNEGESTSNEDTENDKTRRDFCYVIKANVENTRYSG